jgi:hypothetical protein
MAVGLLLLSRINCAKHFDGVANGQSIADHDAFSDFNDAG